MENMELDEPNLLLNLPTDIIEEILLYFSLPDRSNLRLTCKRLYELCNSKRICMKEKFVWKWGKDYMSYVNPQPSLYNIGRYYNLVIDCVKLKKYRILPFFEVNGSKVCSLIIQNCYFIPGVLESIITLCEGLCSLTLSLEIMSVKPESDFFTLEPNTLTRPTVTYLKLKLPLYQPSNYFHRMCATFPNIEHLHISSSSYADFVKLDLKTTQECTAIFDDIMKSGNNLKSLTLDIALSQWTAKGSQFFEALPNLKDLSINFHGTIVNESEKFYSSISNLTSLELINPKGFRSADLIGLLKNNQLNHLTLNFHLVSLVVDVECFKVLLLSQLKIIHLRARNFSGVPTTIPDFPFEANKTVTDLDTVMSWSSESLIQPFLVYFRGLVHLKITFAAYSTLQYIFQFQENLRSLELQFRHNSSIDRFCGTNDGRFKYSLNNLQKLEHLALSDVSSEIISSDAFKSAFYSPRMKYLRIKGVFFCDRSQRRCAKIPTILYENLINLQALRLQDLAMPSREKLLSLFKNLKHLNYLRFDFNNDADTGAAFINSKHFSINSESQKYAFTLGKSFYDAELDRMVIINDGLGETLYSPKISSCKINWIKT